MLLLRQPQHPLHHQHVSQVRESLLPSFNLEINPKGQCLKHKEEKIKCLTGRCDAFIEKMSVPDLTFSEGLGWALKGFGPRELLSDGGGRHLRHRQT